MTTTEQGSNGIQRVRLADLLPDQRNANKHTERGTYMLRRSIERFGFAEAGTLDRHNKIIGGNHRTEAAADVLDADEAIIVEADGRTPIYIRRNDIDLDTPEGRALAVALNRVAQVSIDFDPDVLGEDVAAGVDLGDFFFDLELLDMGAIGLSDLTPATDLPPVEFQELPLPQGIPDTVWPTDNEWGIPLLDIGRQADAFDLPIETWGAKARGTKAGTLHFYTEDYRFSAVWGKPDDPLRAQPVNIVEPNYSVYDQVPRAVALWATYKKRWLARYWQSQGVRIFVDLNVARPYDDINLLGVPRGWKAYATRGYESRLDMTAEELAIARAHAGTDSVLFLVYGGSGKVRQWCQDNGAVWVAEDMDRAKGKYLDEVAHG